MFSSIILALALASATFDMTAGFTTRDDCACPLDLNGDHGFFIHLLPAYQCAYPGGACTWLNQTGEIQNTHQSNCPLQAPCSAFGCACPIDNNGDSGDLINHFNCYQCAYPSGACAWDNDDGEVLDVYQTNCVRTAKCQA